MHINVIRFELPRWTCLQNFVASKHSHRLLYSSLSVAIMDPSAHFYHSELRSDSKFDRGWQKLGIDRVTNCSFDPSGRFCAIYFNHTSIELWDFTSVPVPMTMLILPKNISGRFEGICHSLVWSTNGARISGVFGPKPNSRRRIATADSDSFQGPNEELRAYHFVVWDISSRVIIHKYR